MQCASSLNGAIQMAAKHHGLLQLNTSWLGFVPVSAQ